MNAIERSSSNAVNAVMALDCPWCAEPVRATVDEIVDGLACPACLVQVEFADGVEDVNFVPIAA
ncbi:MAG: hypothetical protein ABI628_03625 [Chloroflexota bacterium]